MRSPRAFNRLQIFKAVLGLVISVVAFALCYLFFWGTVTYTHSMISSFTGDYEPRLVAGIIFAVVAISGTIHFFSGKGQQSLADSDLFLDLHHDTGGAIVVDHYFNRVAGPAYLLSQIFLAGPLHLFKALKRFRCLVPTDHGTEDALRKLLARIEERKKWHPIGEYPGEIELLTHLIRMGEVDFSAAKGTIKFSTEI